jgi:hypothetical protein
MKMHNYIKLFLLFFLIVFLTSCGAISIKKETTLQEPKLNVYIMPQQPTNLRDKKALLAPIIFPKEYDNESRKEYTLLLRDILLQNRVFMVVEAYMEQTGSEEEFVGLAHKKGFDYIIIAKCPRFIAPVGLSRGWTALDLSIIQAPTDITLWHIYSETDLTPKPEKDYIFFTRQYKNAPSVTQGFVSLAMEIAKFINLKTMGLQ